MKKEYIYRELTSEGKKFCALAAVVEEAAVFLVLQIQLPACPPAVAVFLWFLFAFLTAAALTAADELRQSLCRLRRKAIIRLCRYINSRSQRAAA